MYRGRANRGRHLPSEKLKVVCRKVYPCHKRRPSVFVYLPSMSSLWSLVNGRVCGNCWQTALQPCLIITLLMCSQLIVEDYGNVISMRFTGSYYRCYTVLKVPAILKHLFFRLFAKIHFDSLFCRLVCSIVNVALYLRD